MIDSVKDLKYAIVEMIENDKEKATGDSIKVGLLKGIKPHKLNKSKSADVIIVLEDKDKVLNLINLASYNILSIQRSDGVIKVANFFRSNEDDQAKAFNVIGEVMTGMHTAKRTDKNDSNLIDLETYCDLPDDFTNTKVDDDSTAKSSSVIQRSVYNQPAAANSRKIVTPDPVEDKVKPMFFKRVSKKPTEEALKEMEKRIKDLASGKLKVELPTIEGDDEKVVVIEEDDEYHASYMYHG